MILLCYIVSEASTDKKLECLEPENPRLRWFLCSHLLPKLG